ncbi:TetR/AcrR family transcriptional regulator [Rhodovarius crocodyli]|uniref:TetR/AcrR family transcriptional regulator n=1 Tax=Rhodovarius crocodyli TaxID=1979269 RepID=A0A437MIW4_9PROT|nr:TetR/AcrR family transcriptional regulator [Rhodovarius crocodyli]RVT97590.1 TetR/AcrR family transcriptional regulator [Rhodovarius crocodyli]
MDTHLPPKPRAILHAAGDLFLRDGYSAVSMDAVARQAGVSKATLYAHFEGKDALFSAVVASNCQAMAGTIVKGAGHDAEIREGLTRVGDTLLRFLMQPRTIAMHRLVMAEASRDPALAEAFLEAGPRTARLLLSEWMAEEQRRGRLDPQVPALRLATQFGALLRTDLWLRAGLGLGPAAGDEEIAACVAEAVEMMVRAYAA